MNVLHEKYCKERGADIIIACDVTGNSASAVFYDAVLGRTYARSVVFGVEIIPENAASELTRLVVTAMREYSVYGGDIKRLGIAAPVYTETALERGLFRDKLGLPEDCPIDFVPFISAEISGRFTAMLLTLPNEDFAAVHLGKALCAAVCVSGELKCFSLDLCGAFDGSAFGNGIPAEKGAVVLVRRQDDAVAYEVAGDGESVGVSPSGALTAVVEMSKHGIIDGDGIMTDRDMLFIGEDIFISQNDVRAIQADKARTAAALKLIPENIPRVYFSGEPFSSAEGFRAMIELKAVPEGLRGASFTRNSTEQGIILFLTDEAAEARAYELAEKAEGFSEEELVSIDENYLNYLNF